MVQRALGAGALLASRSLAAGMSQLMYHTAVGCVQDTVRAVVYHITCSRLVVLELCRLLVGCVHAWFACH